MARGWVRVLHHELQGAAHCNTNKVSFSPHTTTLNFQMRSFCKQTFVLSTQHCPATGLISKYPESTMYLFALPISWLMTFSQNWAYPTLKYDAVTRNRTQPNFLGRKACCIHIWVGTKGLSEKIYEIYIGLQVANQIDLQASLWRIQNSASGFIHGECTTVKPA
jgi:hypothetical protein